MSGNKMQGFNITIDAFQVQTIVYTKHADENIMQPRPVLVMLNSEKIS